MTSRRKLRPLSILILSHKEEGIEKKKSSFNYKYIIRGGQCSYEKKGLG